jgi:hypothetical protein
MSDAEPWDGISSLPQTFNPAEGPPRMLEQMVPFYQVYIPLMCEGDPAKLKAAWAALAQRNTFAVEDIINPRQGESRMDWIRRQMAKPR